MNVFISWSGALSKEIAELLKDWIKITIQATNPWISSKDIEKGSLWFNKIADKLKETKIGLICITNDNKNNPWLLFEAGALFKGANNTKIMAFLVDVNHSDIKDPLARFNHTSPSKDDVKNMMKTINNELSEQKLDHAVFEKVFEKNWNEFCNSYTQIIEKHKQNESINNSDKTKRTIDDKVDEILSSVRIMNTQINTLGEDYDFGYFHDIVIKTLDEFRNKRNENDIFNSLVSYYKEIKPSHIKELFELAQQIFDDEKNIEEEKAREASYEDRAAEMRYEQMAGK